MKDEDFIRLEQKIDLVMQALKVSGIMIPELPPLSGIEEDTCQLCNKKIKLTINPQEGTLNRTCGCSLPKKAYKLKIVEVPNANNRQQDSEISSNVEE